ncbi:MAG TPA: hypothetical protein VIG33_07140 [Pseudobdellovibrionaceae bacterium]
MKYVYILENDEKFRDEMIEAIHKSDPLLVVHYFSSLDEFSKWIKLVIQVGPQALPRGGTAAPGQLNTAEDTHQLSLIIAKNELLGVKHMALLKKTRELFIQKGLCPAEDPTSLVLTTFENPDFDIKLAEDRIINNVIFKPFDKLILQQHLNFAIGGRHPPSQYAVHNMKTAATIEMLKEVEIEAFSDVGFISISNRPITVGSVAKYYSSAFISLRHKSMLALCLRSDPHPDRKDYYRCSFTYLGADSFQITNIRKQVRQKDAQTFQYEWISKFPISPVEIVLISSDMDTAQFFKENIEKNYHNAKVRLFAKLQDFMHAIDPEVAKKDKREFDSKNRITAPINAIFGDQYLFEDNFKDRWEAILETVKMKTPPPRNNPSQKTELFILTKKNHSDPEKKALSEIVKDIFLMPMDTLYIIKKLALFLPQLSPLEKIQLPTIQYAEIAKAATLIEINEFSEAGLVMKYYRPITPGAFREFILWLPHELELPEFLATCNYHEESKNEKGVFYNQFVFFGTSDHYLKHIRRWILQNHLLSKEAESA